jgi:hypothetical protein
VDEVLFGVLAESVVDYLDGIARGRARPDDVRRLAAAWQALLDLHRPGGRRGRCTGCHKDTMCTVWRVAHAFFVRKGT